MKSTSPLELRAAFWCSPFDALLDRNTTAAGLHHSRRWLIDQESKGATPPRIRIGNKWLYRKREVLAFWGIPTEQEVRHD